MEYILMALFGGGTCDWQDITQTEYDWDEIFERAKFNYGYELGDIEINNLYETILTIAKEDFCKLIKDFINDNKDNENYKKEIAILQDFDFEDESNWSIWCNCLDTHIKLFTTAKVIKVLEITDLITDKERIDDKIGFTSIEMEEE